MLNDFTDMNDEFLNWLRREVMHQLTKNDDPAMALAAAVANLRSAADDLINVAREEYLTEQENDRIMYMVDDTWPESRGFWGDEY